MTRRDPTGTTARSLTLRVEGMTCAGCTASVQDSLEALPGVEEASVSQVHGRAEIVGTDLDPDALVGAIRDRGYEARLEATPRSAEGMRSEIERRQHEAARRWGTRAVVGLGLWCPMAILHWGGPRLGLTGPWIGWVLLAGATLVLLLVGGGFYRSAWGAARRGTTNMDTLIAIGATTAYAYSLLLFTGLLGDGDGSPLYFTEAAALLGLISLGHWLEARAAARAGSAVHDLLDLQPDLAEIDDGADEWRSIPSAEVQPGDRILIRPGARVPVDGTVVDGISELDESVVSGESLPVRRGVGDPVVAGAMNTTGRLVVEAGVGGRDTTVARIAHLVARAQASRAGIQRLADRVCAVFVPAVLGVAVLTIAGWGVAAQVTGRSDLLGHGIIAAVTVLIIACPCALGLATPMAVMVGTGAASRRGILVKSAAALERAGTATTVVLDKTGTLTEGRPRVTGLSLADASLSEERLLSLAAAVEVPSEHPIAGAIVDEARRRGVSIATAEDFRALPGEGVAGTVEGQHVEVVRDDVATCVVRIDGRDAGRLEIADTLRPDAYRAVRSLQDMGLSVRMLSGDRRAVALEAGRTIGLAPDEVHAEATPSSKLAVLDGLPAPTVMVGDGINDAAALARSDLGIALASGTNIAIESADVIIPGDRVTAVPETIALARLTLATIRQNLVLAFLYNTAAIPVAALGLLGDIGPVVAAAAMGLSDVAVIGNALRLKHRLGRGWLIAAREDEQ